MFGKIVQKWNAFKSDWKQYQELCRVANGALDKLHNVRKKITVLYNMGETVKGTYCIKRKYLDVPTNFSQDEFGMRKSSSVVPCDSYCQYFKGAHDIERAVPCTQTSCPCYSDNCEYAAAAQELVTARENRRTFWANAKTKSK